MDSKPVATSSKAFNLNPSDPPEGAATGTELLAISSNHPLENGVVIDTICSFLPGKELLNCRSVNKQWNSSSIRQLRNLEPFNRIKLGGDRSRKYLEFINSRDKNVEWYEESIKYELEIGPEALSLMTLDLSSVQQMVEKFGPDCVGSVHLEYPCFSARHIPTATASDLLQQILHQTNLKVLTLHLYGSDINTQVAQIVNSTSSVDTLILEANKHCANESASTSQRKLVCALTQIHQNVLDNIKELEIKIPGPSSFEILAKITLPKLICLKLVFSGSGGEGTRWSFPDHWQHFQNFIKVSCPSLASCEFKFERAFNTKEEILEPFTKRNINFENTFPRTEFRFVSHGTPFPPFLGFDYPRTLSPQDMNLYEDEEQDESDEDDDFGLFFRGTNSD